MKNLPGMKRSVAALVVACAFLVFGNSEAAELRVNKERISARIMALGEFGKNPEGGVSRVAYSDADIRGREYLMGLMRGAGLDVRIDTAGNIIGRREGRAPGQKPILIGSHADSVPNGGNYDGDVGTIGAIEVAEVLHEAGIRTRHPIEVIIFANEEGAMVGSKFFAGLLGPDTLARPSHSGYTIGEGIARIGGDPSRLEAAARKKGDYTAYIELHIEQGSVLYDQGIDIGVVEGIVGSGRWEIIVEGMANHAGTTPMNKRFDALLTASTLILAINRIIRSEPGNQVGTVGQILAEPGASNVVPGRVVMSLEIRDLDEARVREMFDRIAAEAKRIGKQDGTTVAFHENPLHGVATLADPRIRSVIADAAKRLGLSYKFMPSGAGHDAQSVAVIAPMGMIFVPSVDGISHSPKEYSRADDMANGTNVLLHTVLAIDNGTLLH